jgi:hypothetical protein
LYFLANQNWNKMPAEAAGCGLILGDWQASGMLGKFVGHSLKLPKPCLRNVCVSLMTAMRTLLTQDPFLRTKTKINNISF